MAAEGRETSSYSDELPKIEWRPGYTMFQYKGFWLTDWVIKSLPLIETRCKLRPEDVLLVSFPKSGTTWLKAITFAILHKDYPDDPLETHNPHQLVPFLEVEFSKNTSQKMDDIPSPRIYATHLPYSILPENVKNSKCKIVYIARDPADIIVSGWKFTNKNTELITPLEEYFNEFVQNMTPSGPLFDHVLEYWEKRERENVLFVTYEELKAYPNENVKRIAKFLGPSLSDDEIEQVVRKSSFDRLSKLDINSGENVGGKLSLKYSSYFRNGSVGDGKKYLTPEMRKRLKDIAYRKWVGSGLESTLLVTDHQVHTDQE